MIKTFIKTYQIDNSYSINSFIYNLSRLPIFNDLITEDAYKGKILKNIIGLLTTLLKIIKTVIYKSFYFIIIYSISSSLSSKNTTQSFIHIYFFLTILGMFINNKCLHPTKRKYISIILFNVDGNLYFKQELIFNLIKDFILNIIMLFIILSTSNLNITLPIILAIFTLNARVIGETLNIIFYKKKDYFWYSNTSLYMLITISLLLICLLPIVNIYINTSIVIISTIVSLIIGLISIRYLIRIKDFKLIYKKICTKSKVIGVSNEKDYIHQSRVEVKEKDKLINSKILEKKKGFDLFNTIFFERHREILLRSAKKYAIVSGIIYLIVIGTLFYNPVYGILISVVLEYKLSFFIIIMYFMNRGSLITQAMFFNCDHAMLRYNFYREPKVILSLFKKRLITLIKVNMLPAIVIALGNVILIILTSNSYTPISLITTFMFIISLSVFFSVHYLVIYYLLQPYNKNMQMKKTSYSVITLLTYIISFNLKDLVLTSNVLSIYGIIFVIIYILVSLILVYKISPKTFKIN